MEALEIVMPLQPLPAASKNNFFERICFSFYNGSQSLFYDDDSFPFEAPSVPPFFSSPEPKL